MCVIKSQCDIFLYEKETCLPEEMVCDSDPSIFAGHVVSQQEYNQIFLL